MIGGMGARFTVRYVGDGASGSLVEAAMGRPFGSAALVAPLSWLAQTVVGQAWEAATQSSPVQVLDGLRGGRHDAYLPPAVERAAEFATRALRRALGVGIQGPADCDGPGVLVCRCIGVGDRTIRCAIREGALDPEAIGDACGACTGCRTCRPDILLLVDEETRALPEAPPAWRHPVERVALVHGRRLLRSLGMSLEEAHFNGAEVALVLGASEPWAGVRPLGAVALVRHLLRETVHAEIRVALAPGS